jgi:hypothetical protein
LYFVKGAGGKLVWSKSHGPVSVQINPSNGPGSWGYANLEYRKWRTSSAGIRKGIEARGTLDVSGIGQDWSQDGFIVRGAFPIPGDVPVPFPCIVNLDLRGDWKLHLDVTRRDFVRDDYLERFRDRFYSLLASLFKSVLQAESMWPLDTDSLAFSQELYRRSPPSLQQHLIASLGPSVEN